MKMCGSKFFTSRAFDVCSIISELGACFLVCTIDTTINPEIKSRIYLCISCSITKLAPGSDAMLYTSHMCRTMWAGLGTMLLPCVCDAFIAPSKLGSCFAW